jgi:hypothetical protein
MNIEFICRLLNISKREKINHLILFTHFKRAIEEIKLPQRIIVEIDLISGVRPNLKRP